MNKNLKSSKQPQGLSYDFRPLNTIDLTIQKSLYNPHNVQLHYNYNRIPIF